MPPGDIAMKPSPTLRAAADAKAVERRLPTQDRSRPRFLPLFASPDILESWPDLADVIYGARFNRGGPKVRYGNKLTTER